MSYITLFFQQFARGACSERKHGFTQSALAPLAAGWNGVGTRFLIGSVTVSRYLASNLSRPFVKFFGLFLSFYCLEKSHLIADAQYRSQNDDTARKVTYANQFAILSPTASDILSYTEEISASNGNIQDANKPYRHRYMKIISSKCFDNLVTINMSHKQQFAVRTGVFVQEEL